LQDTHVTQGTHSREITCVPARLTAVGQGKTQSVQVAIVENKWCCEFAHSALIIMYLFVSLAVDVVCMCVSRRVCVD